MLRRYIKVIGIAAATLLSFAFDVSAQWDARGDASGSAASNYNAKLVTITFEDDSVTVATIPAGSFIELIQANVTTAFDGSSGTLQVGDTGSHTGVGFTGSILSTGFPSISYGGYRGYNSTSRLVKVYRTESGTVSQGSAVVIVTWVTQ